MEYAIWQTGMSLHDSNIQYVPILIKFTCIINNNRYGTNISCIPNCICL